MKFIENFVKRAFVINGNSQVLYLAMMKKKDMKFLFV